MMLSKVLFELVVISVSPISYRTSASAIPIDGVGLEARQLPPVNTWVYQGCYSDPNADYRTLMFSGGRNDTMTLSKCSEVCGANGKKYAFFGTEDGKECWCDYSLRPRGGGVKVDAVKCNSTCAGDATGNTKCGGPNALSVYRNPLIVEPASKPIVVDPATGTTWKYDNCYLGFRGAVRTLDLRVDPAAGVTIETCTSTCASLKYTYAGLEYGHECWCGNTLHMSVTSAQDPSVACKQACDDNTNEICGDIGMLSLYMKA
ncbi:hypothetical protein CVT24_002348 [Panaeolus cyanescens]|uniref:WSC domain-containing protein n=1 Tax=Panaeolus cyanescens TaxID=181874 RepID=A0A409W191_9AGAR|nr:hypothetical protein CVT24_002348 [Panaeolus cyanescens]